MSRNDSGGKLERFFTGKGFYIVLFLCASVIGVSTWMLMAGNQTMIKENSSKAAFGDEGTDAVIIPPETQELQPVIKQDQELIIEQAPEIVREGLCEPEAAAPEEEPRAEEAAETMSEAASAESMYIWPVSGQLERVHDGKNLRYDATMQDWRSHDGIDILSSLGCPVEAVRAGTVISVENDGLYGVTVKVDHGDGVVSVYSNLQDPAAVSPGQTVDCGSVLGAVGDTAICESSQSSHLHFAIEVNGKSADPLEYLQA